MVVGYSALFSLYSTVRYLGLQTTAWDMGIYNQAIYSTLFEGKLFYYTADLPANPSGSLFGIHFSPALLLVAPFYLLFPSPITLVTIQAAVLALGAPPLYYYGVNKLGEKKTPVLFALAYLISPMIVGINWYDFHPEIFIPPSVLGAVYFWTRKKWLSYFACILVALASIETAPVIVGGLGLYFAWKERSKILSIRHVRDLAESSSLIPLVTVATSAVWLVIALSVIKALNPINVFYYGGAPLYWTVLGARNITEVPLRVLLNPVAALLALWYDWWIKLGYLALLFGPLLFLPLRSRSLTLLTLPWLGVASVSNYIPFYVVGYQYPSFVAPFIFLGAVEGFAKVGASIRHLHMNKESLRRSLTVASLVIFLAATPLTPWFLGLVPPSPPYQVFSVGSHESKVRELVSTIPHNASILTQPNLFPLVSSRVNAYVIPMVSLFPPGTSFNATFVQWLNASEYVLLDHLTDQISTLLTLPRIRELAVHGLMAQVGEVLLFKKNYSDFPVTFEPARVVLDWRNLRILDARIVSDSSSSSGSALFHALTGSSSFWNSTEVWLPPGSYRATLRMKTDSTLAGDFLRTNVTKFLVSALVTPVGDPQLGYNHKFSVKTRADTVSSIVFASSSESSTSYANYTVSFTANGLESFVFVGLVLTSQTGIYLDNILIEQQSTSF